MAQTAFGECPDFDPFLVGFIFGRRNLLSVFLRFHRFFWPDAYDPEMVPAALSF